MIYYAKLTKESVKTAAGIMFKKGEWKEVDHGVYLYLSTLRPDFETLMTVERPKVSPIKPIDRYLVPSIPEKKATESVVINIATEKDGDVKVDSEKDEDVKVDSEKDEDVKVDSEEDEDVKVDSEKDEDVKVDSEKDEDVKVDSEDDLIKAELRVTVDNKGQKSKK